MSTARSTRFRRPTSLRSFGTWPSGKGARFDCRRRNRTTVLAPATSGLRPVDLCDPEPDEVADHVVGRRLRGGEADGSPGNVEVSEPVADRIYRRSAEREDAE